MGNMALYTVIDRKTNKTVCVNKTSRDLTLLIGIDADRVHQYAKSQNAYKRRWLIYKSGSRVGYDPSKETLRHEWDKTVKWILTGEKQEERNMLAYGVKDIVMDHVICRNAPLAEVARKTGAPAGKIPSMAKGGRLHDGRYLIWVEGELEDIIDQKFREDWDTTRKSVLNGLAEAYKRGESMLKELYKIIEPWWVCEWTLMDEEFNAYDTSCGNPWCLEDGTPEDNKMIYCPACGRKIKAVPYTIVGIRTVSQKTSKRHKKD